MTATSATAVISEVGRRYLRLHRTPNVGPIRLRQLIEHFGTVEAVLEASMAELERARGVGPVVAASIFSSRRDDEGLEREIARAAAFGARIVCEKDAGYPPSLSHTADPPICLYVRGDLQPADAVALAIVGTRRCTHYGREQALRFGELFARSGFTVVSGLARGIDGFAHGGALRGGGRTVAVLGNGLGSVYPEEHAELAKEIVKSGALVSELPVDTAPDAKNFPGRNRIIAGMSLGVLVVEAGRQSGALITARLATEYNREVFALPGAVDRPDATAGSNGLIREGTAKLVTCLDDILDELGGVGAVMKRAAAESAGPSFGAGSGHAASRGGDGRAVLAEALTGDERAVFDAVAAGCDDVDAIGEAANLAAPRVTSTLTALQLKGLIQRTPGERFARR